VSELLSDPKHLRADARLIAKMISLGVVDEERARTLLTKLFDLADDPKISKSPRALATIVRALVNVARLEQVERLSKYSQHLDVTLHAGRVGGVDRDAVIRGVIERCQESLSDGDSVDDA
jgi:hypothetical protein